MIYFETDANFKDGVFSLFFTGYYTFWIIKMIHYYVSLIDLFIFIFSMFNQLNFVTFFWKINKYNTEYTSSNQYDKHDKIS